MRCHAGSSDCRLIERPVGRTSSTGRKVFGALETGVQPANEPAIAETTWNGRFRAPPAAFERIATPEIPLAGGVRSWVNSAVFAARAAPRGEITNLHVSIGVWDDQSGLLGTRQWRPVETGNLPHRCRIPETSITG